jgi:hypothetical protein
MTGSLQDKTGTLQTFSRPLPITFQTVKMM